MKDKVNNNLVGLSKSLTIKFGEDFLKVNVWIQKEISEKEKEEKVLEKLEKIIDEQLEKSIEKFKGSSVKGAIGEISIQEDMDGF